MIYTKQELLKKAADQFVRAGYATTPEQAGQSIDAGYGLLLGAAIEGGLDAADFTAMVEAIAMFSAMGRETR